MLPGNKGEQRGCDRAENLGNKNDFCFRLILSARYPAGKDKPTMAIAKTSPTSPSAVAEWVRR